MPFRYFLKISYDGTAYVGWQIQPNGLSVQELTEKALSLTFSERVPITGAGRTDAGVHARVMFAHFDLDRELSAAEIEQTIWKMNNMLPSDIAIKDIIPVQQDAHARFDAVWRTYEYHILSRKNPFRERFAWYWQGSLDLDEMNRAAAYLVGRQDFQCFSKVHTEVNNYFCEVTAAQWHRDDESLVFTITANRFLRNMVRAVVGTLYDVGRGKISPEDLPAIIGSHDRSRAGSSVPAKGLALTRITYPYIHHSG
jgi:tRNA pseudouridine38-40 synthase